MVVLVWLVVLFVGLGALYLWFLGHWMGAVMAMPALAMIGFFIQQVQVTPANPATPLGAVLVLLGCPALAWVPFFIHRQIKKNRAGESLSLSFN